MHAAAPTHRAAPLRRGGGVILLATVITLSIFPACANAQQTSGWTKFGDIVSGAFGAPVNRPHLDAQVHQQQAQNAWIQAETAEAEASKLGPRK
jgi:hypothetical protein